MTIVWPEGATEPLFEILGCKNDSDCADILAIGVITAEEATAAFEQAPLDDYDSVELRRYEPGETRSTLIAARTADASYI